MTCCGRCKVCRHEWDEIEAERDALAARLAEAERLIQRAREKFVDYEMDSETEAPNAHRELMRRIDAFLAKGRGDG